MKRTVRELTEQAREALRQAGVDSPEWDARALLREALHLTDADLITRQGESVPEAVVEHALSLVERRAQREPLAYILGYTEFHGLRFACDERGLVPRPETEQLVAVARESCARLGPESAVVDVGTGTGVIAITLATLLPELTVWATDVSKDALDLAAANVAYHRLGGRVRLRAGRGLEPLLAEGQAEGVAVVVSNPPYIRSAELETLQPEVARYEPRLALDGGPDGLQAYRELLEACADLPNLEVVHLEMGADHASVVSALVREYLSGAEVEVAKDLAGLDRVVSAYLPLRQPPRRDSLLVAGGV